MRFLLLVGILLLGACDQPASSTSKIALPQREALEKAKDVNQVLQDANNKSHQQIEQAEGQ